MSNRSRFIFGKPPFRFLAEHLAQDDDFLKDAKILLGIPPDQASSLSALLQTAAGFLGKAELAKFAKLADVTEAQTVADIINRLGGVIHDAEMPATEAMDAFAEVVKQKCKQLSVEEREELSARIRIFVAEPMGIALRFKSQQLMSAVGSSLEGYGVICDIRPVFDADRAIVQGAVSVSTLRLEYMTQSSEQEIIELSISESQLDGLIEKLQEAKRKQSIIKGMLNNWSVPMPHTAERNDEGVANCES